MSRNQHCSITMIPKIYFDNSTRCAAQLKCVDQFSRSDELESPRTSIDCTFDRPLPTHVSLDFPESRDVSPSARPPCSRTGGIPHQFSQGSCMRRTLQQRPLHILLYCQPSPRAPQHSVRPPST